MPKLSFEQPIISRDQFMPAFCARAWKRDGTDIKDHLFMSAHGAMPKSAWAFPALSVLLFAAVTVLGYTFAPSVAGLAFATVLLVILFGTVFAAVHHAEVIAHAVGEPFGTLLLTLAVTIIEVALIASIMLGDKEVPTLARDTVFAVVMIVCNALVGICIFIGALRYREQDVQVLGANLYLSVLFILATITLVLPNYTLTTPGPIYSAAQLGFVSVVTMLLYGVFLYTQTIRHRGYFVGEAADLATNGGRLPGRALGLSIVLLLLSLLAVVLLAKKFSIVVDAGIAATGAPPALAGVLVAMLILLPEGVAAVAAARKNDLQKSINLALGSSLATIGLTIPAVSAAAYALDKQLVLGLDEREMVLLLLTFVLSMLTFGNGRTNVLSGLVHLVVFAVFVFLVFVP
jgi:Ca2+:H+ antiporter